MEYSSVNLIPLFSDEKWVDISGSSITNNYIDISSGGSCRVTISDVRASSGLKAIIELDSKANNNYEWQMVGKVNLEFYDGSKEEFTCLLNNTSLVNDKYANVFELPTKSQSIKNIIIYLYSNISQIRILSVQLYSSSDINSDELMESLDETYSVKEMEIYTNGVKIKWTGDLEDLSIKKVETNGVLTGVVVDGDTFIPITTIIGEME